MISRAVAVRNAAAASTDVAGVTRRKRTIALVGDGGRMHGGTNPYKLPHPYIIDPALRSDRAKQKTRY